MVVGLHRVVRHALFEQFPPPSLRQESKDDSPQCSAVFQMQNGGRTNRCL